jgi:hypothetical protein
MLSLKDPKWQRLKGGYAASAALLRLERGEDVWEDLWQALHHQGDVGVASYAAVPQLVRIAEGARRDWNLYGLTSTIEVERHRKSNPPLPKWLAEDYHAAWKQLLTLAIRDIPKVRDALTVRSILGAMALAKGDLRLGALISGSDDSEITDILDEAMNWSEAYR